MRITGLSCQWGDRLFEVFPEGSDRDTDYMIVPTAGRLLRHMLKVDGPDLWVLSSHSLLSFYARDAQVYGEKPPTLAWASAYPEYHIEYPLPREFRQAEDFFAVQCYEVSVEDAVRRLLRSLDFSDANPERISAQWNWYICPECDLHSPEWLEKCPRCLYRFPNEVDCKERGYWHRPFLPDRAAALQYPERK